MFKRPNGELADIYSLKQTYLNFSKQMLPFNIFVFVKGDNEISSLFSQFGTLCLMHLAVPMSLSLSLSVADPGATIGLFK